MEKGSFQTSVKSVREIDDFVEHLALPNQLPPPPEFPQSRAVETLLSQNADLMARLSVSIRSGSQFETRVGELEKENLHLRHKYDSIKDQILVIQEKERLLTERSMTTGAETTSLKERLKHLERRYAEVYTQSKDFQRQIGRLRNYRFRIQKAIVAFRSKVSRQAEEDRIRATTDSSEAQVALVNKYEEELAQLRRELELLRRRAADRDLLYDSKIRIENQLIFEQRQAYHYREETQKELQTTKEENLTLRDQLKSRLIEIDRFEKEILAAVEKLEKFERDEKERDDQIESLQLLWREKQAETERLEEKNRSLQKLNQQLSVTINANRKDLLEAKAETERQRFSADEKIKALEFQMKNTSSAI